MAILHGTKRFDTPIPKTPRPRLIPDDHVRFSTVFPDAFVPVATAAEWIIDPASRVAFELAGLDQTIRKWMFLNEALGNPDNADKPGSDAARDRCTGYHLWGRQVFGRIIELEYAGTSSWELLAPSQRRQFGCDAAWLTDADAEDLYGAWKRFPAASRIPDTLNLSDFMDYQWTVWNIWPEQHGRQEYVRRGWLRGPQDMGTAAKTQARKTAIANATRDRWYGDKT